MNAELLLAHFDRISDAPGAVLRLRRFILDLAVRGKLVEQSSVDHSSNDSLGFRISSNLQKQEGVPRGWFAGTVGDFLDFQYGKGLPASERKDSGLVPVFGSNGVVGYCSQALSEKSTVIIGRKGSAGALNLCEGSSWTTDVAYFVEPPEFFNIRYLYFALHTLDLDTLGKGVKPGLSRNDAYQLDLCVPPLVEQHRIVAKVDELMTLCDRLEGAQRERENHRDQLAASTHHRLNNGADVEDLRSHAQFFIGHLPRLTARPDQIKQLRQTILNLAVRGKLVAQNPGDEAADLLWKRIQLRRKRDPGDQGLHAGSNQLIERDLLPLPESWIRARLCTLVTRVSDGEHFRPKVVSEGVPFLSAKDVREDGVTFENVLFVTEEDAARFRKRCNPEPGDVLVVSRGATVGRSCIVETQRTFCLLGSVILLKLSPLISSRYILWMLKSGETFHLLKELSGSTAQQAIYLRDIKELLVPLPPLAEQHRIVSKVDELMALCDQLESRLTAARTEAARLLESVLHHALQTSA
jgi:type I restriction enzyme S subunit